MRRHTILPAVLLAGCVTPEPPGPLVLASSPSGATVALSDGRSCQTPCSVPLAGPVTAQLAKAGHRAETVALSPDMRGTLTVTLDPAGRATQVEEIELDLEPAE